MPPTVCQAIKQLLSVRPPHFVAKNQTVGSDSGPDLLNVVVDGNPVDLVESFTYQTSDRYCRSEITRRIGLASSAMSSLNNIPIKDDTAAENWAKN